MKSPKLFSPKIVIIITLILFLGLIVVASTSAIYFISSDATALGSIVNADIKQRHLYNMNRAASQRILYLHKMINSVDPFEQDEIYIEYMKQGDLFLQSSTPLKQLFIVEEKEEVWEIMYEKMVLLRRLQNSIIEIILNEQDGTKTFEAQQILINRAVPAQDDLLKFLSTMLDIINDEIKDEFDESVEKNKTANQFIILITIAVMLLGIVISAWVLRHFLHYEVVINIEKNKAIQANIKKSQFLANMSHEIRTPLTAIIGFSQVIRKSRSDIRKFEDMCSKIINNGQHLLDLINDVLDLLKIEAGELTVETISTSPIAVLDEVITIVSGLAEKKGIVFEPNLLFPIPGVIDTDPVRLKQILINLCSNAIKFTTKGTVIITVNFDHLKNKLYFKVTDSGVGMSSEVMEKIFLPFSQADMSTTRKYGGTGLGLNISRSLSEELNGALTCSSIEGIGSEFKLVLDVGEISNDILVFKEQYDSRVNTLTADEGDTTVPELNGTILVVEDSQDNCDLIAMYIEDTTADYTIVGNGQLAVDQCSRKQFDLILMDMQMPVMDGFEAVKKLRENGYRNPIVMLTANALKIDIDKCFDIGADGHLAKPIELDKFYLVLKKYLALE